MEMSVLCGGNCNWACFASYLIVYVSFNDWPSSSDHQQHPVCSKRLTLHLITVVMVSLSPSSLLALRLESCNKNVEKTNKQKDKAISLPNRRIAGPPCRKQALVDTEDGLPSFVWTTRSPLPLQFTIQYASVEPLTQLDILLATGCTVRFPQSFPLSLLFIFRSCYISIELIILNSVSRNNKTKSDVICTMSV